MRSDGWGCKRITSQVRCLTYTAVALGGLPDRGGRLRRMSHILIPPKKWVIRSLSWIWAICILLALIVALVDGLSRW